MQIVHYPHPALRRVCKPIKRVDAGLRKIVREMFDLMYENKGVGLAAGQVDLPLRLFVTNLKSDPAEGQEYVFINPVLSRPKGQDEKEEGCLSFPELYAPVKRPEEIHVTTYNLQGEPVEADLSGLMARVVQHENDHLDGVLFVDRLATTAKLSVREALAGFEAEFDSRRRRNEIPGDDEIAARLAGWEAQYC